MKLGCIFKTIILVVVFLGIIFYLYEKYGEDFISESEKNIKEMALKKIDSIINEFSKNEIEKPVKERIKSLLDEVENKKNSYTEKQFNEILSKFEIMLHEDIIDEENNKQLEKIIKNEKE